MPNSFLLDTCTLVRLAGFPETLSAAAREAIENAWYLYASPVSLWEVIFKCQIGKLELSQPPKDWFTQLKSEYDIKMLPLTEEAAALAGELPLHHRDPADRFIIATAKLHDLPVITTDGNFSKYEISVIE